MKTNYPGWKYVSAIVSQEVYLRQEAAAVTDAQFTIGIRTEGKGVYETGETRLLKR